MRWSLAVSGLAAVIALPIGAHADKLSKASEEAILNMLKLVSSGEETGPVRYGELVSGGIATIAFEGDRSVEYYFNVICDDDCTNVDLAVLDAAGVEIDVDDADDAAPVLNVMPDVYRSALDPPKGEPRPMTVEVRMIDCKAPTCAYGLMITRTD